MARLGFHANESSLLEPLNISQARKLQLATEKFAEGKEDSSRPRSKTADLTDNEEHRVKRLHSIDSMMSNSNGGLGKNVLVGLEQLVHSQHMDADGQEHVSRKNTMINDGTIPMYRKSSVTVSNVKLPQDNFEAMISRKAFRTENCLSWNAGDDEDFKYTRK